MTPNQRQAVEAAMRYLAACVAEQRFDASPDDAQTLYEELLVAFPGVKDVQSEPPFSS